MSSLSLSPPSGPALASSKGAFGGCGGRVSCPPFGGVVEVGSDIGGEVRSKAGQVGRLPTQHHLPRCKRSEGLHGVFQHQPIFFVRCFLLFASRGSLHPLAMLRAVHCQRSTKQGHVVSPRRRGHRAHMMRTPDPTLIITHLAFLGKSELVLCGHLQGWCRKGNFWLWRVGRVTHPPHTQTIFRRTLPSRVMALVDQQPFARENDLTPDVLGPRRSRCLTHVGASRFTSKDKCRRYCTQQ